MTMTETQTKTAVLTAEETKAFARALKNAILFASGDRARPVINAVRLEVTKDQIKFVATDTYVLFLETMTLKENSVEMTLLLSVDFAKQLATSISKKAPFLRIESDGNDFGNVTFDSYDSQVSTRQVDGIYPDYVPLISDNIEAVENIGIGAKILGKLSKLDDGQRYSSRGTGVPMKFAFNGQLKCMTITISRSIQVLVMPVRMA